MKEKVMKKAAEAVTKTSQVETVPVAEKTAGVKTVEEKTEVKTAEKTAKAVKTVFAVL